jgi:parallel beta-helix repeat protein
VICSQAIEVVSINSLSANQAAKAKVHLHITNDPQIPEKLSALLRDGAQILLIGDGTGRCISVEKPLVFGAGASLVGKADACLETTLGVPIVVVPPGADFAAIADIKFDQHNSARTLAIVKSRRFRASHIQVIRSGVMIFSGADSAVVEGQSSFHNGVGEAAILLSGSYNCKIIDNVFHQNVGFGIDVGDFSHDNFIARNQTRENRIELVGVRWSSHHNIIHDNVASHTGDNCFSITGNENSFLRNVAFDCRLNGIGVYGSGNTIENNIATSNGQNNKEGYVVHFGNGDVVHSSPTKSGILANILVNPAWLVAISSG